MYREHFNLKERPFTHAPGQRFYAPNTSVSEAISRLGHALTARDAIAVVTGGPGVGKTTLAECALAALSEKVAVARVDLRYGEPEDLYASILLGLDADADPGAMRPAQALHVLRRTMARLVREDRRIVLCLDIGGISTEVARHLLRVVNLAGEHDCQMNILLMGPHPLHQQVDVPALIQLRQRIVFRHRVRPLTLAETERYVRHQVEAVGGDPTALMSSSVSAAVYCYVAGVPRLINTLLDAALSDAAMQNLQRPDGSLIKRTADGLGWKPMTPPQSAAEAAQRPASTAPRSSSSRSAPPRAAAPTSGSRPAGAANGNGSNGVEPKRLDLPPASEMTLQLRTNGNGAPVGNSSSSSSVTLASDSRSPTAAIFGAAGSPAPSAASSVPPMDSDDTSATGMLRLQDLDDRFAETVFGKDAEELEKKRAD